MVIRQRVLSYVGFGDNAGIWEGSIVYKVLYFAFVAKAIVSFVARFFMVVVVFIEVPSERYGIRHSCRV